MLFLDKVNTVPIINTDFPYEFVQWLSNTVDTLNEVISDVEVGFNLLTAPSYTTTQISSLFTAGSLPDGVILYDNVLNVYVGSISGALVKFSTTAYP